MTQNLARNSMYNKKILLVALLFLYNNYSYAQQCYPSDPNGVNVLNQCPNTPQPDEINRFYSGKATNLYFGRPSSPSEAGEKVYFQRVEGKFWTEINSTNGSSIIKDNMGNSIKLPK